MQIAPLLHVGRGVTAIIGGGGKTTLMETLAGELSKKGKVIITTTTHICRPKQYETLLDADEAAVSAALERSGIVCVASQAESGKLCAPWLSMGTLAQLADFVLVEADGAKRLPLKAHASPVKMSSGEFWSIGVLAVERITISAYDEYPMTIIMVHNSDALQFAQYVLCC